jgi:hypothetical protein
MAAPDASEATQGDQWRVARDDVDRMDERADVDRTLVSRHDLLMTEVRLGEIATARSTHRTLPALAVCQLSAARTNVVRGSSDSFALAGQHQRAQCRRRVRTVQTVEQHLIADCQRGDRLHDFRRSTCPQVSHFHVGGEREPPVSNTGLRCQSQTARVAGAGVGARVPQLRHRPGPIWRMRSG